MNFISFVIGAAFAALAWFAYDLGKQTGRREMRKLARFQVDLERWEFEEEPVAAPSASVLSLNERAG